MSERVSKINRKTNETEIDIEFNIDGTGNGQIDTGIGFFDHMLHSFTKHGFFDMKLTTKGDLYVDTHHTIEDTGIVLGEAIKEAIGDLPSLKPKETNSRVRRCPESACGSTSWRIHSRSVFGCRSLVSIWCPKSESPSSRPRSLSMASVSVLSASTSG